jgi:hypothetical protein
VIKLLLSRKLYEATVAAADGIPGLVEHLEACAKKWRVQVRFDLPIATEDDAEKLRQLDVVFDNVWSNSKGKRRIALGKLRDQLNSVLEDYQSGKVPGSQVESVAAALSSIAPAPPAPAQETSPAPVPAPQASVLPPAAPQIPTPVAPAVEPVSASVAPSAGQMPPDEPTNWMPPPEKKAAFMLGRLFDRIKRGE